MTNYEELAQRTSIWVLAMVDYLTLGASISASMNPNIWVPANIPLE
jgi:hypothetical protein